MFLVILAITFILTVLQNYLFPPSTCLGVVTANTLIGASRGSIGNATMTRVKGQNILKEKILQASGPNSEARQYQKSRYSLLTPIARTIKGAIDLGFAKLAIKKSPYNAWFEENSQTAAAGGSSTVAAFVPTAMKTGKGTIGVTLITTVNVTTGTADAIVSWAATPLPVGGAASDVAIIVIWNETTDEWTDASGTTAALRSAASKTVTMVGNWTTADLLHTWLFFRNPTTGKVSDSDYSADAS